jgi:mono/diheme cytochrome c family protein
MLQVLAMTRVVSIAIASLLATSGAAAAEGSALEKAAPAIRFDRATHDLGAIPSDRKQVFSWAYHNDGTAPLEIIAMNPSCGCTASVAEPKQVTPGAAGVLQVTYDPSGQSGDVRKTLTVVTNDPLHPRTILTILAKVLPADEPALPNGHPRYAGQSPLMGSCATCHAAPAQGKNGAALWEAVCAMCHGGTGESLGAFVEAHDDPAVAQTIAYGTANPKMPGFSELMGGPLDAAQVASLVALLRARNPARKEVAR